MQLREYQIDLIKRVRQAFVDGLKRPCVVLGCGGGKSIIAAELAKRTTAKGNRVLFLVHRQELCEQIQETFSGYGVDMGLCTIGMVQTITRRLKSTVEPKLIITDENHHALAASYRRIYERFPNVCCVGITATPVRLGGGGLGDVNDKLIIGISTKTLIENNYLAPFDYYAPPIVDLTGIHTSKGDYISTEVTAVMNKPKIYGDVIGYYRKLSDGKQAICYCASVTHSKRMAEEFNAAGITAAHVDGETVKEQRKDIINGFRSGETKILCNVDLISEGFDVPDCNTAILLRPTKSLTLFIQQSMRCMRYKPGKRAVIIDHVGNYSRFGLPDADREWSLDPKPSKAKQENEIKAKQCPMCFCTHEPAPMCPQCGYVYPAVKRTIEEVKEAQLEKITQIVINYDTSKDCKNISELRAYAKTHNYKSGWVWHQSKLRGFM